MEETKKNIRIDSYDFFGYLVPGFLVFVAIAAAHVQIINKHEPQLFSFAYRDYGQHFYPILTAIVIAVIILSYILGHAVATLASFFYERMIVRHIWGYPFKRLLFETSEQPKAEGYKAITVATYLYLFTIILTQDWLFSMIKYSETFWPSFWSISIMLLVTIFVAWKTPLRKHFSSLFTLIEDFMLSFTGRGKPFPTKMRNIIRQKIQRDFHMELEEMDTEVFWATYWNVITKHDYIKEKVDKWLVLYSFMRNVGAALLLSAYILCLANIFGNGVFVLKVHSIILYATSILVTARYYYLYYSYYTKSVFRAYAFLGEPLNISSDSQSEGN